MARSELEQLRIRMLDNECDLSAVQDKLIQIRTDQDCVFAQQATKPLPSRPTTARGSSTQTASSETDTMLEADALSTDARRR